MRVEQIDSAGETQSAGAGKWLQIGGTLSLGLFVAYLDRTALSVAIPAVSKEFNFAGANFSTVSSWLLTIFLIGYAFSQILGGIYTRGIDPKKVAIVTFATWSIATAYIGISQSIAALLICRLILGIAEGIYWPQQSRFVAAWFAPKELTKANSVIQYYGQFLALALGFIVMTPIYDYFGWRVLFLLAGGVGVLIIVPLYMVALRPQSEAPYVQAAETTPRVRLTLHALGGPRIGFLTFAHFIQGMLFWGITLWIPLAVRSFGFTGIGQGLASALPYGVAMLMTIPMAAISDRTNKRVLIAGIGLLVPGILLLFLPQVDNGYGKLALVSAALGIYSSCYPCNFYSIVQSTVDKQVVGSAVGIINGIGAGGGGTLAGFIVGLVNAYTGSYSAGFMVLGGLAVLGSIAMVLFGKFTHTQSELKHV
jgi:MFS family permease